MTAGQLDLLDLLAPAAESDPALSGDELDVAALAWMDETRPVSEGFVPKVRGKTVIGDRSARWEDGGLQVRAWPGHEPWLIAWDRIESIARGHLLCESS